MNRILDLLRGQLARPADLTDRHLLDRFLAEHDEAAFAELVRRYGRVVWGVCRRLANHHDAEDAFQATFLVLVRRADRLSADVPLGPWLHRVAVMTARNVIRGNRRRAGITGPMESDVAAHVADPPTEWLDLDAALLALPERYRVPVVLCHLQGMTRREAAERLGCAEGTLSARLHRALARLRIRLGGRDVAALALAGAAATPAALAAATVRSATIYTTSTLTTAGLSPAVAGLTDGVLRMFWMKKMAALVVLTVLVGGGLLAGVGFQSEGLAQATVLLPGDPQAPPENSDAALKRLNKQIEDLRKQKELLGAKEMDLFAEKARLEETAKAKAAADAAAQLGKDIAVVVENGKPSEYRIYEVVNGKIAELSCSDLDMLTTYLRRAFNDPKGPKKLRIGADKEQSYEQLRRVFAACAAAGYMTATCSHDRPAGYFHRYTTLYNAQTLRYHQTLMLEEAKPKDARLSLRPGDIDLRQYAPKK